MSHRWSHVCTAELVAAAVAGDDGAWREILNRYELLVWRAVNFRTGHDDERQEAYARTWLRAASSLHTIREPEHLGGWLATVADREALAVARARWSGALPSEELDREADCDRDLLPATEPAPDHRLLAEERAQAVREALVSLDPTCRKLITLLILQDPPLSYAQVETELERQHGWIGPTRRRCLDRLRSHPAIRQLFDDKDDLA